VTDTLGLTDRNRTTRHIFADGGFAGRLVDWATDIFRMTVQVVRKPGGQRGFTVIPNRWQPSGPWPGSPHTDALPATTNATPRTPKP
jgi:hypothetical protein